MSPFPSSGDTPKTCHIHCDYLNAKECAPRAASVDYESSAVEVATNLNESEGSTMVCPGWYKSICKGNVAYDSSLETTRRTVARSLRDKDNGRRGFGGRFVPSKTALIVTGLKEKSKSKSDTLVFAQHCVDDLKLPTVRSNSNCLQNAQSAGFHSGTKRITFQELRKLVEAYKKKQQVAFNCTNVEDACRDEDYPELPKCEKVSKKKKDKEFSEPVVVEIPTLSTKIPEFCKMYTFDDCCKEEDDNKCERKKSEYGNLDEKKGKQRKTDEPQIFGRTCNSKKRPLQSKESPTPGDCYPTPEPPPDARTPQQEHIDKVKKDCMKRVDDRRKAKQKAEAEEKANTAKQSPEYPSFPKPEGPVKATAALSTSKNTTNKNTNTTPSGAEGTSLPSPIVDECPKHPPKKTIVEKAKPMRSMVSRKQQRPVCEGQSPEGCKKPSSEEKPASRAPKCERRKPEAVGPRTVEEHCKKRYSTLRLNGVTQTRWK